MSRRLGDGGRERLEERERLLFFRAVNPCLSSSWGTYTVDWMVGLVSSGANGGGWVSWGLGS